MRQTNSQSYATRRHISDSRLQNSAANDEKIITHHANKQLYRRLCELDAKASEWLDDCPASGVQEVNAALTARIAELEAAAEPAALDSLTVQRLERIDELTNNADDMERHWGHMENWQEEIRGTRLAAIALSRQVVRHI